jgi:hypothetical protein
MPVPSAAVPPRATLRFRRTALHLIPSQHHQFLLEHFPARGISRTKTSVCCGLDGSFQ